MISVVEAQTKILACVGELKLEKINVTAALGRVLGEDIYAARNIPAAANSAMDGYAVRAFDTKGATKQKPVQLAIVEEISAGRVPQIKVKKGQTARIMTGALIPGGANAVVRQEDAGREGESVFILTEVTAGKDIRFAGEDVRKGELVLPCGIKLQPAAIGMLASLGWASFKVYRRPRVAIIATGNELVKITKNPPPAKIVNSNSYSLAAQVLACGGIPVMLGIARDKTKDLQKKFSAALNADIIISTGGVSVGDYDLVKDVMGKSLDFWQVAMKPGKPLAFGLMGGVPLFGLPGNPVSAMVSFEQFVRPALLKMQGCKNIFRPTIKAVAAQEITKKAGIKHFIRAIVRKEKGKFIASITGDQGSGILKSMILANGLIIMDEKKTRIKKGEAVDVQLFAE